MTRLCVLVLLALAVPARADEPPLGAVALLPLDADAKLAIYGQPVASEIARALVAGGIDVVVVGPKMAVPDKAWLVVDGTITSGKGDTVVLSLRVRNPVDGSINPTKPQATAQGLPNIDKAAADLSSQLLPVVRQGLTVIGEAKVTRTVDKPIDKPHVVVVKPDVPQPLVLVLAPTGNETLRAALAVEAKPWAAKRNYTIADAGNGLQLALEVKGYSASKDAIPYAKARVRAKITNGSMVLFDRVVVTDSVLGDKGIAPDALATRTAREVLDILRPHMRRAVAGWR